MHERERDRQIYYIYTYILYTYCTIICIHLLHKSPNCGKYGPYWTIHEYTLYNLRCMDGIWMILSTSHGGSGLHGQLVNVLLLVLFPHGDLGGLTPKKKQQLRIYCCSRVQGIPMAHTQSFNNCRLQARETTQMALLGLFNPKPTI